MCKALGLIPTTAPAALKKKKKKKELKLTVLKPKANGFELMMKFKGINNASGSFQL
jgi:hypothetical protein